MFIYFSTYFLVFLLGLCIGSFLNVVILRLEKGESFAKGRSYCPNCKHQLAWFDLIPVFSFLFLKGRCRYCGKKISIQYPLVELAAGILFIFIFWKFGFIWNLGFGTWDLIKLCFMWYVISSLIIIFVYDLKYYLIPDKILFPAIIIAFFYRVLDFGNLKLFGIWDLGFGISPLFLNYFIASIIASGFFLFIFLISRGAWMGFGDVKLAILLGLLLGFPNILVGLFLSFFFGAILGVILLFFKKYGLKSELPFAPFLIIGTLVALFFGEKIIDWYLHFLYV